MHLKCLAVDNNQSHMTGGINYNSQQQPHQKYRHSMTRDWCP